MYRPYQYGNAVLLKGDVDKWSRKYSSNTTFEEGLNWDKLLISIITVLGVLISFFFLINALFYWHNNKY